MASRSIPPGWFEARDAEFYNEIYNRLPEEARTAEIGTYRARSLCSIAQVLKRRGTIQVLAIDNYEPMEEDPDPNRYEAVCAALKRFEIERYVRLIPKDSLEAATHIPDGTLDFVFLDGNHEYANVKREIETYLPKLKPGGLMGGHDYYDQPGVRRAVNEKFTEVEGRGGSSIWLTQPDRFKREQIGIAIATPGYSPSVVGDVAVLGAGSSTNFSVARWKAAGSLLACCHNQLWARALNERKKGITHICFLHSDVEPMNPDWLEVLYHEMVVTGADVISAIIPIKDHFGVTSTAFDIPENRWGPARITLKQVNEELPETWTSPRLLVNTGMMLVDMRKPWVEQICFTINDAIARLPDGTFAVAVESEDWNFSRQAHRLGAKIFATRKIPLYHYGTYPFPSNQTWGKPTEFTEQTPIEDFVVTSSDGKVQTFKREAPSPPAADSAQLYNGHDVTAAPLGAGVIVGADGRPVLSKDIPQV